MMYPAGLQLRQLHLTNMSIVDQIITTCQESKNKLGLALDSGRTEQGTENCHALVGEVSPAVPLGKPYLRSHLV
jgi:hypothetical protein